MPISFDIPLNITYVITKRSGPLRVSILHIVTKGFRGSNRSAKNDVMCSFRPILWEALSYLQF